MKSGPRSPSFRSEAPNGHGRNASPTTATPSRNRSPRSDPVVWKFGTDMAGRLNFAARPLKIGIPFNFQNMSEDGRLWYGWALLEEACKNVELRRTWSAEPEELEANYSILRCAQLQATLPNGDLMYQVRATSRDCKFRDNESFLALQDENIAGFLDLRVRDLLDTTALPAGRV